MPRQTGGIRQPGMETELIRDEIARCEDIDELRERILPQIHSQQEQ